MPRNLGSAHNTKWANTQYTMGDVKLVSKNTKMVHNRNHVSNCIFWYKNNTFCIMHKQYFFILSMLVCWQKMWKLSSCDREIVIGDGVLEIAAPKYRPGIGLVVVVHSFHGMWDLQAEMKPVSPVQAGSHWTALNYILFPMLWHPWNCRWPGELFFAVRCSS